MIAKIRELIQESVETKNKFLTENNLKAVSIISDIMVDSLQKNCKILSCGNGGSASDSLHFSAELWAGFRRTGPPWPGSA